MRVEAQFVRKDGRILWQEHHDLLDHGCVYLCHHNDDAPHMVYKLGHVPMSDPVQWCWTGLWNSRVICGKRIGDSNKWQHLFSTIEEAVGAMMDQPGWRVWKAHFDGVMFK